MKKTYNLQLTTSRSGFTPLETPAGKVRRMFQSKQRGNEKFLTGFTLIELLVVVAIIGLLSSIISVAVNTSRIKSRDAKRVTDMKQIKTGLDLYFNSASGYPDAATWVPGTQLQCNGSDVMKIPEDPMAPTYLYTYTPSGNSISGCSTTVRAGFDLQFFIENKGQYYIMDQTGNIRDALNGAPVGYDQLL